MMTASTTDEIRAILETDRTWSAYALADLDPALSQRAEWLVDQGSVVLLYRGLQPPVLFAHGEPQGVAALFDRVAGGQITFTLQPTHRALLKDRLQPRGETNMWRMVLRPADFPGRTDLPVVPLGREHAPAIEELLAGQENAPDSFSLGQLDSGIFYGVIENGKLLSMAGTHVLSTAHDVAAIGNVFTDPAQRGRHYGRATCAAVAADLLAKGIGTIVLNVGMENQPAMNLYRSLGFWPFCGYHEGVGWLAPIDGA